MEVNHLNSFEGVSILALEDARRHLKMNRSLLEMLKGNTSPEDLANLQRLWVSPCEDVIADLESQIPARNRI